MNNSRQPLPDHVDVNILKIKVDWMLRKFTSDSYRNPLSSSSSVHHFIPANFPMYPILESSYIQICNKTWKRILSAKVEKMKLYEKSGMVLFSDEFFHRLFQRDDTMEEAFATQRMQVLIKAMTFMLNPDVENDQFHLVANRCRRLGFLHRSFKGVQPHHFGIFVGTLIETIMFWLSDEAAPNVGEAWSNVVGFYIKHILQAYLLDPAVNQEETIISHPRVGEI